MLTDLKNMADYQCHHYHENILHAYCAFSTKTTPAIKTTIIIKYRDTWSKKNGKKSEEKPERSLERLGKKTASRYAKNASTIRLFARTTYKQGVKIGGKKKGIAAFLCFVYSKYIVLIYSIYL